MSTTAAAIRAAAVSRDQVLRLYKDLLRHGAQFRDLNVRQYALRRVRQGFRENADLRDGDALQRAYEDGVRELEVVKRQSAVSRLFGSPRYVTETAATTSSSSSSRGKGAGGG